MMTSPNCNISSQALSLPLAEPQAAHKRHTSGPLAIPQAAPQAATSQEAPGPAEITRNVCCYGSSNITPGGPYD